MYPVRDHKMFTLGIVALLAVLITGCDYMKMRGDDFLDVWNVGAGVTAESQDSVIPPSIGAFAEFGPLGLGAITHNGYTAEIDGRGIFVGPESRTRLALLWFHKWRHNQDYDNAAYLGRYKDYDLSADWHERMMDLSYTKKLFFAGTDVPAKDLLHEDHDWNYEVFPLKRGWQYWETIGLEAAISDPFLTHFGIYLRLGIDPSEILDFLLGIATIDLKQDDLYQRPEKKDPEPEVIVRTETIVEERPVTVEVPVVQHSRYFEFGEVLFELGAYDLTDGGHEKVDEIVEELADVDVTKLVIEGHTCDIGTEEDNQMLSENRAQTVADALTAAGFDAEVMEVNGYGEMHPRVPNTTEANRSLNRRVEVEATYNQEIQ